VSAADIARALGNAEHEGRGWWRCVCPRHYGHSLTVHDRPGGRIVVQCFGGCDYKTVFRALFDLGLLGGDYDRLPMNDDFLIEQERERDDREAAIRRKRFIAAKIWDAAKPGVKSPQLKRYLGSRGITIAPPVSLRWVEKVWHSTTRQTGIEYPAMIGKVVDVTGELIAIHKTYLTADGSAKVCGIQDKEYLAPVAGGAVRLAWFDPERPLIIGEGTESTLSLMQLRGLPGWSALSAGGIKALVLPRAVRRVLIAVDNDRNGAGQDAAREAAWRWQQEGREVRVAMPPVGCDFNDVLRGGV